MTITRPRMILFDYGGTLLCEPEWDMLRGEKALFEHVVSNPHHYTPEELCSWEREYFQYGMQGGIRTLSSRVGAEHVTITLSRYESAPGTVPGFVDKCRPSNYYYS